MKDNIMSFLEVDNTARNLDLLEGRLGREVPTEMLMNTDLSKGIMSFNEIDNMARNLNMLENRRRSNFSNNVFIRIETYFYTSVGIGFLIYVIWYICKFYL